MKKIFILLVLILSSCATFTSKDLVYSPSKRSSTGIISITLTAQFETQLGYKYASISPNDIMESYEKCTRISPGEKNDGYLKSILCKTYYILQKKDRIKLANANSDLKEEYVYNIKYILKEKTSISSKVWSWANILSLTLIPYRGKRTFDMTVDLSKSGSIVKQIQNKASFTEWRSIFLLPMIPFSDGYQSATDKILNSHFTSVDNFFNERK